MPDIIKLDTNGTDKTRVYREAISMNVFCHTHPLAPLRNIFRKQNIVRSATLRKMGSGSRVRICGMVTIIHTPPTKSGKRVMFVTLEDEMGLVDLVVFPGAQEKFSRVILTSEVLAIEGKLQRNGVNGKAISVIMDRALVGLCGPLTKLLGYVMQTRNEPKRRVGKSPGVKRACQGCEDNGYGEQLTLCF